ncbi:MAG: helix-turn-helix domain-containing protein [Gemmataceae bacterium]
MPPADTPAVTLDSILAAIHELRATLTAPPAEMLSRDDLAALLGVGVSTLDRYRALGEIGPQPVSLGGQLRWRRLEVLAWLAHRDHRGELHTTATWPAIWAAHQRKAGTITGR